MKKVITVPLISILFSCLLMFQTAWAVSAFPGAEGGGAVSVGGRGGAVILVTNLNDSGTGSLRACVTASGPRTCIFRVGGTINLTSHMYITTPFLTVAGQTAPGDGIMIKAPSVAQNVISLDNAHDVIWRYTRIAHGYNQALVDQFNSTGDSPGCNWCLWSGSYNAIFDHNSTYWNVDEGVGAWHDISGRLDHVTFSYNIIAEGLRNHSTAALFGGVFSSQFTALDMHHNLIMNNSHRNPMVETIEYRHVNNLTYNNLTRIAQLQRQQVDIKSDWIRNIFKRGPLNTGPNGTDTHEFYISGQQSVYLQGNKGQWHPDWNNGDQWDMTAQGNGTNGPEIGLPANVNYKRSSATNGGQNVILTPLLQYPITAESPDTLEATLLPTVSNYRRLNCDGTWTERRDTQDLRLVSQYQNNTGVTLIPANENDAGGYPTITGGTACVDTDSDGMPDVWEAAHGLNPNLFADTNLDRNSDGFTNLEEYLAGISGVTDVTAPAPPTGMQIK